MGGYLDIFMKYKQETFTKVIGGMKRDFYLDVAQGNIRTCFIFDTYNVHVP